MRQRCLNPNDTEYANYGGRGITVCKEWLSFEAFAKWALESGYSETLTIDRKDVNLGYCPENCRWATLKEQMNNKRNNVIVDTELGKMTLAEYCDATGAKYGTLQMRFRRQLNLSLPRNYRHRAVIRDDGKIYETIAEASRDNGVVDSRIKAVCNGERTKTAGHSFALLDRESTLAKLEGEK